ncbi:MAG: PQQ-dependent sugar dehydrogenase [Actinomycetes bacterium]
MRLTRFRALGAMTVLVVVSLLGLALPGTAQALPVADDAFALTVVASQIRQPHALRAAPDGRLFMLEQTGRVRVIEGGQLLTTPALTLDPTQFIATGGSAGLLSVAFPPDFATATTKYVYLLYTHTPMTGFAYPHNVVSRFAIDGNAINVASEEILVHLDSLNDTNGVMLTQHYGGDIEFGPEGKLYVTTGDLFVAPNGQSLNTRLGKVLRYNPNGTIPADNPFYGSLSGGLRAIWAYGLRNPFKITYDEPTGRLIIGDVGAATWEEVNVLEPGAAGLNFGWSETEGYDGGDPRFVDPLLAYPHADDGSDLWGCAVMGGDTYRPATSTFPASYAGRYFFADHCEGWLRTINPATGQLGPIIMTGLARPVDMAVASDGALWVIQREPATTGTSGALLKLQYSGTTSTVPTITSEPPDTQVALGESATFDVIASGTQPLTYQWRRDGQNILGATGPSFTLNNAQAGDDGAKFSVVVSNGSGSDTSRDAILSVVNDLPPKPVIATPKVGATFAGGTTLTLIGSATDPEDGVLPASAFEWNIVLHHNVHTHPEAGPFTGVRTASYTIPRVMETDPDVFFRIHLKVTDSDGVSTEVVRDVMPRTVTLSVQTLPRIGSVVIDGQPTPTPTSFLAVVGVKRTLSAQPITVSGTPMVFDTWNKGVTRATREFNVPAKDKKYEAYYRVSGGRVGTGTGLKATYFANPDFTSPKVTKTQRVPYFDWGTGRPASGVPADNFSARWKGDLQAQFTGRYEFTYQARAGEPFRLVLGGNVLINTFANPTTGTVTATASVTAGQRLPIVMKYRESTGSAAMKLQYAFTGTPLSVLPRVQLYPTP